MVNRILWMLLLTLFGSVCFIYIAVAGLSKDAVKSIEEQPWFQLQGILSTLKERRPERFYLNSPFTLYRFFIPDSEKIFFGAELVERVEFINPAFSSDRPQFIAILSVGQSRYIRCMLTKEISDLSEKIEVIARATDSDIEKAHFEVKVGESLSDQMRNFCKINPEMVENFFPEKNSDAVAKMCVSSLKVPSANEFNHLLSPWARIPGVEPPEFIIKNLFDVLINSVQAKPEYQTKIENGIALVCLGCGTGVEANIGQKMLQEKFSCIVDVCGIDSNKALLEMAGKQTPSMSLYQCDGLKAAKAIKKFLNEKSNVEKLVVVVAVRFLSRGVLNGTRDALSVLQQVAFSDDIDLFAEVSDSRPLLDRTMIEAAGWHLKREYIAACTETGGERVTLNLMTPRSVEDQMDHIYQQSQRRKKSNALLTLDLAMTSSPDLLFKVLKCSDLSLGSVTTVDLSWSHIPESFDTFFGDLKSSNISKLVLTRNTKYFNEIIAYISSNPMFTVFERTDGFEDIELPPLPVYFERLLLPEGHAIHRRYQFNAQ